MRVVAAIIESNGELLACRRASHKSLAGKWEFPGGKVEPGETEQQALVREIREELGWEPAHGWEEGLAETVAWYRDNPWWWRPIKEQDPQFKAYYQAQYHARS